MGWAIALHGGAGGMSRSVLLEQWTVREAALRDCLNIGVQALQSSENPLDVVELVVRELENRPCFNAGKGSVLTSEGTVEMEACIMDGKTKKCGAVSGLTSVVNPISVARLVMEKTPHVYLAFEGAEAFAKDQGVELAERTYFITEENIERLKRAKSVRKVLVDYTTEGGGTVGCVAVDEKGNLAAATSTGGLVNKMAGRIGDTPMIGCGTYANEICAVSATGTGESIIRHTVARDVAFMMQHSNLTLSEAAQSVVNACPPGDVGLIAVSADGLVATPFNTAAMFRAYASQHGPSVVAIF